MRTRSKFAWIDEVRFGPLESTESIMQMRDGYLRLADNHPNASMSDSFHYAWVQANTEIARRLYLGERV